MKSITFIAALASLSAIASANAGAQPTGCTVTKPPLPTVTLYNCNPDGTPGKPPSVPTDGNDQPPNNDVPGSSTPGGPGEPGKPGQPENGQGSDGGNGGSSDGGNESSSPENPDQPETVPGNSDGGDGNTGSGNPDQPDTVPVSEGVKSKAASLFIAILGFLPFAL